MPRISRCSAIALILFVCFAHPSSSRAIGFGPATLYPVGTSPDGVVVGDFNGDGKLDLAVTNYAAGTVSILLGNGDGTFQTAVNFPTGPSPVSPIAGDFNGDHKLDLIVLNQGNSSTNTPGAINVLLGNGDGTFQAPVPVQIPAGLFPVSAAVADFNADGKLDLIVSETSGAALNLFSGNGDGTFKAAIAFPLPAGIAGAMAVADFNMDGKADLAIVGAGAIHIFLGNGDGTFQTPTTLTVFSPARSVQAADLNNDGKLDLVVISESVVSPPCVRPPFCFRRTTDRLSLFPGNGDGSFQAERIADTEVATVNVYQNQNSGYTIVGPAAIADFNGDGKPDLGITTLPAHLRNIVTPSLKVILGKGDGTFSPVVDTVVIGAFVQAVADLNADKNSDLVLTEGGTNLNNIGVLLNTSPVSGADLAILTAGASANTIGVASNLTYLADVINQGPQDATNVTFTDTLPNGVNFVSAIVSPATQGSCVQSNLVVTCTLGALASAFDTQVTIVVTTPAAPGTITNTMMVQATEPDLAPANNTASQVTTVLPVYTLTVAETGDPTGSVTATPAGISGAINCPGTCSATYLASSSVNVSATPNSNSLLLGSWTGACSGTANPCAITMNMDNSVTANFVAGVTLSVTVAGGGNGTVISNSGGIGCENTGGTCSALLLPGSSVSLTAVPIAPSLFAGWSGACTGTDPTMCSVTMNSAQSVTATFNPPPDFSVSPASPSLALPPNSQGTDVLTFAAQGGFSSVISLSCGVTGPSSLASCSLSPTTVTPGANPATSTLKITVPGLSAMLAPSSNDRLSASFYAGFLTVSGIFVIGLGLRSGKTKERRLTLWLAFCLTLAFLALQVGCGVGNSGPPAAQNYTVTVTAASGTLVHSTSVPVIVQ